MVLPPLDWEFFLLRTAFDIRGNEDLNRFKTDFERGNWLDLNSHLNLRPNTKSVVECVCSITFYVYLVAVVYQLVGTPPDLITDFFKKSRFLRTLVANDKGKKYNNNLCFSGT